MDFGRFRRDVRLKYFFAGSSDVLDSDTPKQLVVKSTWCPGEQDQKLENKINQFTTTLESLHFTHLKRIRKGSNLTNLQKSQLAFMRNNEKFIILMCDKNLGPAIIERATYIKLVLQQHLLDSNTYTNLTKLDAELQLNKLREQACEHFGTFPHFLDSDDRKYFHHFLGKKPTLLCIPQFYGMAKVHKNKFPTPL